MLSFISQLVIFAPLLAGIYNGLFHKKMSSYFTSLLAISGMLVSFCASIYLFKTIGLTRSTEEIILFNWFTTPGFSVNWSVYLDSVSTLMFLVISSISLVVHIYSAGYMHNDKNMGKFLTYISLFSFFMYMLVASDNFIQLFFGWEGVGLCSYLLISYYYHKESANKASIKAFIVNRISDFAFIIAIITIYHYTGSINFKYIFSHMEKITTVSLFILDCKINLIDLVCLLLFIGCMGKSAQIGLHVWLPDAMEGPTPASALIHAATMVTAGVFLLARCAILFEHSEIILHFILVIGTATCIISSIIAITQSDIKKIIAYSTCSQLGYMFIACGVSAYNVAMFHLMTHAFFKALLFLCAGNIIHATKEQNIFNMGGLYKKMPVTYTHFMIGSAAIIGIFPLAGFYSKHAILNAAYTYSNHHYIAMYVFAIGIIAAALTAIYSVKMILLVFHNSPQNTENYKTIKEVDKIMTMPLWLLTAGSLLSGLFGYYILRIHHPLGYFGNSISYKDIMIHIENHHSMIIEILPTLAAVIGIISAIILYYKNNYYKVIQNKLSMLYKLCNNKFYFDEIYNVIIVKPLYKLFTCISKIDSSLIDNLTTNATTIFVKYISYVINALQKRPIYGHISYMITSLVIIMTLCTILASLLILGTK